MRWPFLRRETPARPVPVSSWREAASAPPVRTGEVPLVAAPLLTLPDIAGTRPLLPQPHLGRREAPGSPTDGVAAGETPAPALPLLEVPGELGTDDTPEVFELADLPDSAADRVRAPEQDLDAETQQATEAAPGQDLGGIIAMLDAEVMRGRIERGLPVQLPVEEQPQTILRPTLSQSRRRGLGAPSSEPVQLHPEHPTDNDASALPSSTPELADMPQILDDPAEPTGLRDSGEPAAIAQAPQADLPGEPGTSDPEEPLQPGPNPPLEFHPPSLRETPLPPEPDAPVDREMETLPTPRETPSSPEPDAPADRETETPPEVTVVRAASDAEPSIGGPGREELGIPAPASGPDAGDPVTDQAPPKESEIVVESASAAAASSDESEAPAEQATHPVGAEPPGSGGRLTQAAERTDFRDRAGEPSGPEEAIVANGASEPEANSDTLAVDTRIAAVPRPAVSSTAAPDPFAADPTAPGADAPSPSAVTPTSPGTDVPSHPALRRTVPPSASVPQEIATPKAAALPFEPPAELRPDGSMSGVVPLDRPDAPDESVSESDPDDKRPLPQTDLVSSSDGISHSERIGARASSAPGVNAPSMGPAAPPPAPPPDPNHQLAPSAPVLGFRAELPRGLPRPSPAVQAPRRPVEALARDEDPAARQMPHPESPDESGIVRTRRADRDEVPPATVASFERLTGIDLGFVPVERGAEAERAPSLHARGFTSGGTVHIPAEAGGLDRADNETLVAHELAHVAQQRAFGAAASETAEHADNWELQATAIERAFRGESVEPEEWEAAVGPLAGAPFLSWTADEGFVSAVPPRAGAAGIQRKPQYEEEAPAAESRTPVLPNEGSADGYEGSRDMVFPDTAPLDSARDEEDASRQVEVREPMTVTEMESIASRVREMMVFPPRIDLNDPDLLEGLALNLYDRMRGLMRVELIVDRERSGALTEFH